MNFASIGKYSIASVLGLALLVGARAATTGAPATCGGRCAAPMAGAWSERSAREPRRGATWSRPTPR